MTAVNDNIGFLGSDDVREFEALLHGFVVETRVQCALLVDRVGRLIATAGDTAGLDGIAFASLASADFAASHRLAALLGEEDFASLYHHGAQRSMFLADISGAAVLAVLFDTRTTLGMVRIKTKWLVPRFAEQLSKLAERGPSGQVVQMEPDWAADVESEIDRLFVE
jgi:predicted regulator of Ras-like GTPase activity (Roadblock/LC7/MglB family)